MKERISSRALKKSLMGYSIFAILLISLTVAFIAAHPLYSRLKEEQRRHLLHRLEIKRMIVEEYLSRARDTALQVTSRTQIRKKLAGYNRQEVSLEELVAFTGPKLADAMNLSEEMAGITRLDGTGEPVVQVGLSTPSRWWPRPARSERPVPIRGPLVLDDEVYIALGANILDRDGSHVGTDIILFRTRGLRRIVEGGLETGSGGETILCRAGDGGLSLFFESDGPKGVGKALPKALANADPKIALSAEAGMTAAGNEDGSTSIYAYGAVAGTDWILVLRMDQGALFRTVNRQLLFIGPAIVLFLLLGLCGMTLLLRPLAGRILVHTEELEQQNVELRKLAAMKDGLLRDVSHELKTPVAKQAMQLEILKPLVEKHSLAPQEKRAIRVMEKALSRQQTVIRNLLDLSRLEAGGRELSRAPVRLDRLLAQVREDYRHAIDEFGVDFRMDVGSQPVSSDGEMLWHVFSNVVNNAIKFRRKDVTPTIVISSSSSEGRLQVRITDNGIGLSEEGISKVFSRFYQATASTEGSGVGLTIAKMIMERLGGSIRLESPGPGKGCTAVVSLPDSGTAAQK